MSKKSTYRVVINLVSTPPLGAVSFDFEYQAHNMATEINNGSVPIMQPDGIITRVVASVEEIVAPLEPEEIVVNEPAEVEAEDYTAIKRAQLMAERA